MAAEQEQRIVRVREGDNLPSGTCFLRLVATEEQPVGTGTTTQRVYVVLVALHTQASDEGAPGGE